MIKQKCVRINVQFTWLSTRSISMCCNGLFSLVPRNSHFLHTHTWIVLCQSLGCKVESGLKTILICKRKKNCNYQNSSDILLWMFFLSIVNAQFNMEKNCDRCTNVVLCLITQLILYEKELSHCIDLALIFSSRLHGNSLQLILQGRRYF